MRNLVIEHSIIVTEIGEPLSAIILDGKLWGEDFDNLCEQQAEVPATYHHNDGYCNKSNQWVTYSQTFIRTEKTDEQLLAEYK